MTKKDDKAQGDDLAAKVAAAAAKDAKAHGSEKKLIELEDQVKSLTETAARAQAELQNAKIRMEREAKDMRAFAAEAVLSKFLPTIDNFQRAFKHLPEDLKNNEWVKGITAIEQDFVRQVGEMGLKKFESLGQKVDPTRHEVLMSEGGDTIAEVFEDGYEMHGKVVRVAKVKLGK